MAGLLALAALVSAQPAAADRLSGYCLHVPSSDCRDNGKITAITTTDTPEFGLRETGHHYPEIGTFYLDVLIPDSVLGAGSKSFTIKGDHTEFASVSSTDRGDWRHRSLANFLDRHSKPSDHIGAWLGLTRQFQPSARGYDVYDFNFGTVNFAEHAPTFSSSFAYPEGTIITAFFCAMDRRCISTPRSRALMIESQRNIPEPESLPLFATALASLAILRRRKSS